VHRLVAYTDPSRHRIEATPAMIEDILLHSRFQPLAARRLPPLSTAGASRRILA